MKRPDRPVDGHARPALGSFRATRSAMTWWGRCGCCPGSSGGWASTRGVSRPATRSTSGRPGEPASWHGQSCPVSRRLGMTTTRTRTPSGAPLATSAQALRAAGDHQGVRPADLRAVCLADPILRTLPNLAFPNATDYPVAPEQRPPSTPCWPSPRIRAPKRRSDRRNASLPEGHGPRTPECASLRPRRAERPVRTGGITLWCHRANSPDPWT